MNILVLLAGVLDPKWPVAPDGAALPARPAERLILSPFDEAALEVALKLRDARPASLIRAVVAGGHGTTRLARAVAAFNVAEVATLALSAPWDQASVARQLAAIAGDEDLILIGREFGDCDDGIVPPMLAGLLDRAFFGRVQTVETTGPLQLFRENGPFEERLNLARRVLASVTNDRRARLRKPLMKNVMMARQAAIQALEAGEPRDCRLALVAARELAGARAPVDCDLIEGLPHFQADRLAELLLEAR